MVSGSNLSWQGIKRMAVYTKGQAWYVNVQGSVHWKGVYRVRGQTVRVQNFFIDYQN